MPALFIFILSFWSIQTENFWHTLAEVSLQKSVDTKGYEIERPVFSKHLKTFNQKKIRLKGYIIPMNEVNNAQTYMFSSLPFNVCYFCGAAGPETVVELQTPEKIKFTSKSMIIEGVLVLNENDPDHHIYILKSVKIIQ